MFSLEVVEQAQIGSARTTRWPVLVGRVLGFLGTLVVVFAIDAIFLNQAIWREIMIWEPEVRRLLNRVAALVAR